jgi:hypothetical protein
MKPDTKNPVDELRQVIANKDEIIAKQAAKIE